MQTLEKIAPIPVKVDVAGERLCITPIKTRELPPMMRAVAPILSELGAVFKIDDNDSVDVAAIMKLFASNADAIINAVSIGCRKPREWVDGLDVDDLIAAAAAVIESNADFFVHRVLPALTRAVEGASKEIGQGQSTD